jgi:hypothetical protein
MCHSRSKGKCPTQPSEALARVGDFRTSTSQKHTALTLTQIALLAGEAEARSAMVSLGVAWGLASVSAAHHAGHVLHLLVRRPFYIHSHNPNLHDCQCCPSCRPCPALAGWAPRAPRFLKYTVTHHNLQFMLRHPWPLSISTVKIKSYNLYGCQPCRNLPTKGTVANSLLKRYLPGELRGVACVLAGSRATHIFYIFALYLHQ